jgi:DNA-binding MarR family transcriptional regulator
MMQKEDYVALAAFRRALRRFLKFAEEGARSAGITPQQHQILLSIKGQEGREWASIGELAEAMQLKHHATVGLVDRCQAAGLIGRSPNPSDRRVVRVTLTARGETLLTSLTHRNLNELKSLGQFADGLRSLADSDAGSESGHFANPVRANP